MMTPDNPFPKADLIEGAVPFLEEYMSQVLPEIAEAMAQVASVTVSEDGSINVSIDIKANKEAMERLTRDVWDRFIKPRLDAVVAERALTEPQAEVLERFVKHAVTEPTALNDLPGESMWAQSAAAQALVEKGMLHRQRGHCESGVACWLYFVDDDVLGPPAPASETVQ